MPTERKTLNLEQKHIWLFSGPDRLHLRQSHFIGFMRFVFLNFSQMFKLLFSALNVIFQFLLPPIPFPYLIKTFG